MEWVIYSGNTNLTIPNVVISYSNEHDKEEEQFCHLNEITSVPLMQLSVRNCAARLQNCASGGAQVK